MNKAILIIDMPSCCSECSLMFEDEHSYWCPVECSKNETDIYDYVELHRKPDWCPLRQLPEKQDTDPSKCSEPFYDFEFEHGYNQCIDEIISGYRH